MPKEREQLEQEIAETTRSLQRNIALLEEKTLKTVEGVTDTVKHTADRIRSGVQELSIKHQLEERPVVVMAVAVGAGVLTGLKLFKRRRTIASVIGPTLGRTVVSAAVSQAASTLFPIALGLATEWLADRVAQRKSRRHLDAHQ